jgi:hypothetical protein
MEEAVGKFYETIRTKVEEVMQMSQAVRGRAALQVRICK